MDDVLLAYCTFPSLKLAETVSRQVVEERLAACVSLAAGQVSLYRWDGKICRDEEVLATMKTTRERLPKLRDLVLEMHEYDCPEFLAVPITDGSPDYLAWLRAQVQPPSEP